MFIHINSGLFLLCLSLGDVGIAYFEMTGDVIFVQIGAVWFCFKMIDTHNKFESRSLHSE
jgi:hypothetical protein